MMTLRSNYSLLFFFGLIFFISGCGVYSFTGASIPAETKTFSVSYFENKAPIVQPTLSSVLTEKIKDKFTTQTNLQPTKLDGDLQFEGYISDYQSRPVSIQGNELAALNRLTISVWVKFVNKKDPKQDFETTFTRYADYDSRKNLSTIESDLINEICLQLTDDLFNKSVINW